MGKKKGSGKKQWREEIGKENGGKERKGRERGKIIMSE